MQDRLFGIETEYAVSGLTAAGRALDRDGLASILIERAAVDLPHLCGRSDTDLFLQNGGRLYIDSGYHPEMATPECLDPWDAVRFVRAGDRMLSRLASNLEDRKLLQGQVLVFRTNVDYAAISTWGCHESYLHRSAMPRMSDLLVPHLVSRLIFTGAGGFRAVTRGVEFTLSPRSDYIATVESQDSVSNRGIVNTRREALAGDGSQRLHIILGESLCSDLALWLKVGTTALVVAMIDGGESPGADVGLDAPVEALRTFALDPSCRATATVRNGRKASALDIQRHYLAQAETHRRESFMPPWSGEVCARWRETLDLIERGPEAASTRLDWAIKHALFVDHAARRHFRWDSLRAWSMRANAAMSSATRAGTPEGAGRDRLGDFMKFRQELLEIDKRFGQLGPDGIFETLDRGGLLDHHVDGVGDTDIEHAVSHPPARGRARLRGEAIARLSSDAHEYQADWTGIWSRGQVMNLQDPFQQFSHWQERGTAPAEAPASSRA